MEKCGLQQSGVKENRLGMNVHMFSRKCLSLKDYDTVICGCSRVFPLLSYIFLPEKLTRRRAYKTLSYSRVI